jgi:hypothetical protein
MYYRLVNGRDSEGGFFDRQTVIQGKEDASFLTHDMIKMGVMLSLSKHGG